MRHIGKLSSLLGIYGATSGIFALSTDALHIQRSRTVPTATPSNITEPISAAWMYMSDDQNYTTIPAFWSNISFATVDVLYVAPVGIQADGSFGLYNSTATGPLANRFQWIIETARSDNPNIKILASQWWGTSPDSIGYDWSWLNNTDAETKYASTVASFIDTWGDACGGGIDGIDIDYESENVVPNTAHILSKVRSQLNTLSSSNNGRPYYITVSPADTEYLKKAVPYIDYVNMQTYAGGSFLTAQDFNDIGFRSNQLLWGLCPETACTSLSDHRALSQAEHEYKKNDLAGVHVYRLNSGNYAEEDAVERKAYEFLHPSA